MDELIMDYLGITDNQTNNEADVSVRLMSARDIRIGNSSTQLIEYSWGVMPIVIGSEEYHESL